MKLFKKCSHFEFPKLPSSKEVTDEAKFTIGLIAQSFLSSTARNNIALKLFQRITFALGGQKVALENLEFIRFLNFDGTLQRQGRLVKCFLDNVNKEMMEDREFQEFAHTMWEYRREVTRFLKLCYLKCLLVVFPQL